MSIATRIPLKLVAICPLVWLCLFVAGNAQAQDEYYMSQGAQFDARGDYDNAIAEYGQALAICPTDAQAFTSRGFDWYRTGDYDKALADFDQAVVYSGNVATTYNNRGTIESSRGDYDKAKADFYRALAIDPNCATSYENLAFLQATCPDPQFRDGKKAFENASRGYQLATGAESYYAVNSLAAAYAECGDFDAARTWQAKVVEMAPPSDKQLQTSRLDLYKQNKAYRSAVKSPGQVR
jgi:tetratricopeptide (TPR) repeat protein